MKPAPLGDLSKATSTMLFAKGALACLFGIVAMTWPLSTALTLVILWGAYALVDGVTTLVAAFRGGGAGTRRTLDIAMGVIGVVAGLIAVLRPFSSAVALTWVICIWFIARGILEIVAAFGESQGPRWLLLLGGLLWIGAGALFAANPGAAALGLTIWLGAVVLAWGLLFIGAGIAIRAAKKRRETA